MEDQPKPGCSRDVPAAKKIKGDDNNSVEDKEAFDMAICSTASCHNQEEDEEEDKEAREEKCLIVRAPDERRQRLYFKIYDWFDDWKGLLHQEEHFPHEGVSIFSFFFHCLFFVFIYFFYLFAVRTYSWGRADTSGSSAMAVKGDAAR